DRGYDADWIRAFVFRHGAWANIPPRRNRKEAICFSPHLYRACNLVERFFNRPSSADVSQTRYDKLAANYLAIIQLASIRLRLRVYEYTALGLEPRVGAARPLLCDFNRAVWRVDKSGRQDVAEFTANLAFHLVGLAPIISGDHDIQQVVS